MKLDRDHWNDHAGQWQKLGPPLKPSESDIKLAEKLVSEFSGISNKPLKAMLLGVTPELALMNWPAGTELLAVDRCVEMIQKVWPDNCSVPSKTVCTDWRSLPVADGSVDIVIGDGCYTLLESPEEYKAVSAELVRALKPTGRFIMRFFVQPSQAESTETVFADLKKGIIGNFHIFKWRLAMSLHKRFDIGVRLVDIWKAWDAEGIEAKELSKQMNWPIDSIESIDAYRNIDTRYTFPALQELRACLSDHFIEQDCFFRDYELGERCPVLVMSPRSRERRG